MLEALGEFCLGASADAESYVLGESVGGAGHDKGVIGKVDEAGEEFVAVEGQVEATEADEAGVGAAPA